MVHPVTGKDILWDARGNNFSILFAQLIAAKLNCYDCIGIPEIDDAKAWLCEQGIKIENYDATFDPKS